MKRTLAFTISVLLSFIAALTTISAQVAYSSSPVTPVQQITPAGPEPAQETLVIAEDAVHAYFFYANDCPHCHASLENVIYPLQAEWADKLDIRLLEIGTPEYYEALLAVESYFNVSTAERSIPTLIVDDQILIGENEIFNEFPTIVREGIEAGGIPFPEIDGVDPQILISINPDGNGTGDETCETGESCEVASPIFAAYFFQTGCDECSRVNADLNYVKTKYPQLQVVEFNIYDYADLASWMTEQIGYTGDFHTPALFIGDQVLVGEDIYPDTIVPILEKYQDSGIGCLLAQLRPRTGSAVGH